MPFYDTRYRDGCALHISGACSRPLAPFVRAPFGTYKNSSYSLSRRLGEIKDEHKHRLTAVV